MDYYAHSTPSQHRQDWEPLRRHLEEVAAGTAERAAKFGAAPLGHIAGLLHDLGKYSDAFQRRLSGSAERVDHAAPGACAAIAYYHPHIGKLLAFGIAGHHAGLADANAGGVTNGLRTPLNDRLRQPNGALGSIIASATSDGLVVPAKPPNPAFRPHRGFDGFQFALLGRMLFSCLVDADYIKTEEFYARIENRKVERDEFPSLDVLSTALNRHLADVVAKAKDTPVNRLRSEILAHVRAKATEPQGVFTLTVPTGGGKTLASLAFALDHARRHGLARVIVVIPFTSIVDQTASVYRTALAPHEDAVLEHHSAFDETKLSGWEGFKKLSLAMENWASPVVVTTAVQFFESLFANRPSRCRKLHNIAKSIVVLDEAQTLPQHLLRPCVAVLDELARNYRTSIVLSTATQPAVRATDVFRGGFEEVCELAPDPPRLFAALKRVRVKFAGPLTDGEVALRIGQAEQALCIVNTRAHARQLYEATRHLPGVRHLSTLMCATHRRQVLQMIRADLDSGKLCRVIATSLVEAGVDLDFPLVMRAEAGLDSIAQAAGRCNREGRRDADESLTIVFEAEGHPPPKSMRAHCDAGRAAARLFRDDPLAPEATELFFRELYWSKGESALDGPGILAACARHAKDLEFPYASIASDFRMIDDVMLPVIVPFDGGARGYLRELDFVDKPGRLARKLQPYVVPIPPGARTKLIAAGAAEVIRPSNFGDQFVRLLNDDLYEGATGLNWDEPTFRSAEGLIG